MFKMDSKILKRSLHEKCKTLHLNKIRSLEKEIEEAERGANESEESDIFDTHKMQLIAKRDMFASQLQKESTLLETLYKVDPLIHHDSIQFGSVVITDMQNIFVSIGMGKIDLEGDLFYAISTQVPFYDAMKGLKKGDTFTFRGRQIQILDVI